ncbi:hypothetical protein ACMFMG_012059 [Clarireedia jacksonii]
MNLIDVDHFKTHGDIRLLRFHNPPKEYAILSHTWIENEGEVSLTDLMNPREAARKPGFAKIKSTCIRAHSDGYSYVWIDTCCIDKKSSSELAEAINSMYMWYSSAAICYVYLVDLPGNCPRLGETGPPKVIAAKPVDSDTCVAQLCATSARSIPIQSNLPPMDDKEKTGLHQEDWVSKFTACRWFRRGWTLQELIAPKNLEFYGKSWNFIGNKLHLLDTLSNITKIDQTDLSNRSKLEELSIAKRLSWAAHRETTRIEDRAYSLLGLLDINMPLLYGEGKKAFTRLQEEIIRRSADSSVFTWCRGIENGLLAPSLDHFEFCGKVTLRNDATVRHSFELTHRGLKLKVPILKQHRKDSDKGFLAVLNCYMEGDPERVLCLHLKERIVDPTSSGETTVCSIEKCTPNCGKSQPQHWNNTQLHSINSGELQFEEYRTVLLPRYNFQSRSSDLEIISSLCIKKLPSSLQVVEVFPERQWNIEIGVMSKYQDLAWNILTKCGGVLLKHTLNRTIAVCFFITPDQQFIKVLNSSKMSLQELCKDLESRMRSNQNVQRRAVHQFRAPPSRLVCLQATLEFDMGENAWCVEVSQSIYRYRM